MRRIVVLFTIILALLLPVAAMAAKLDDLWVTDVIANSPEDDSDAIHWWYSTKEKVYYLFLPTCAQPESVKLHFTGPESLSINGETVKNGDSFPLVPGESYALMNGKKSYTLNVMQSSNVATLFIETESGNLDYIHKKKGNEETGKLLMLYADGAVAYDGDLEEIKGRGNATFHLNKKPYQIKLAEKTDLFGMGKHKTWILLANYGDNSLLRNALTFQMARAAGLEYTPKSDFCDVYINNEYYGSYEMSTKVQIGDNRIEIQDLEEATEEVNNKELDEYKRFGYNTAKPGKRKGFSIPNDPEDITGGYLLEFEKVHRYDDEVSGVTTKKGQPIVIKEPEYATDAQTVYVANLMQYIENGIRAKDGVDPTSGKHYTDLIDLDSFVKKYLIEEITKNYDGNKSSLFFYKPVDSVSTKLMAGPVWDYDNAYGNEGNKQADATGAKFSINNDWSTKYYWFPAAYRQEDFRWRAQELYTTVFLPILEAMTGEGSDTVTSIDAYGEKLEASAAMNFKRWPVFNIKSRPIKTGANYQENLDFVKNFIEERMAFLDKEWVIPYQNGQIAQEP